MPAVPPGQLVAPGVSTGNTFPQWGVGGGQPGSSSGWQVVEAANETQKLALENEGILVWFTSQSAAQSYESSEENPYESGSPQNPLDALGEIGDFFHRLTEGSTWERVGEVAVGVLILWAGIKAMTTGQSPGQTVKKAATAPARAGRKAGSAAVTYAAPEARLARRVVAKKVAPKTTARVARARTRVQSHHAHAVQYGAKKPYNPKSNVRPIRRAS
jgi:hypothetical protein